MRLFSTLLTLVCAIHPLSQARAIEPIVYLPLNEGAGETVHDPRRPGVEGMLQGPGSSWTEEVPRDFVSGSAWSSDGSSNTAIIVPGEQVSELNGVESFTIACWVNVREARHLSRIASKADQKMEAFFDLRLDEAPDGNTCIALSLRTGKANAEGYLEKNFEIRSDPLKLPKGWFFLVAVREGGSGEITFYYEGIDEHSLKMIGTGKGPLGAIQSGTADLLIGNIRANMNRALNADFSEFRIYNQALTENEIQSLRQQAFKR